MLYIKIIDNNLAMMNLVLFVKKYLVETNII